MSANTSCQPTARVLLAVLAFLLSDFGLLTFF
jgi:hypothetical protein